MSAEKNQVKKTSRVGATNPENASEESARSSKPSSFGTLIRTVLIAGLVLYMVKPYLFDKSEVEEGTPQTFTLRGETMGTTWNARVCASPQKLLEINNARTEMESKEGITLTPEGETAIDPINSCEGLLASIVQREVDKVDSIASTFKADSEVSKFNRYRQTDWFSVSPETAEIVQLALDVYKETNGAFDVTIAPLVNLYSFGPNKAPLVSFPTDEEIAALMTKVGSDKLEVRQGAEPALRKAIPELTIDLSAIAKGYAVDCVRKAFEEFELTDYMIEVGGEVCCRGLKVEQDNLEMKTPWKLGIQTPEVASSGAASERTPDIYRILQFERPEMIGVLATSGDYNNYLRVGSKRFSHIVDPRTGKPVELVDDDDFSGDSEHLGSVSIASTLVRDISCARADAYATAFFVLGEKEGIPLADELQLAALYLYRSDDSAVNLRESASKSFTENVKSQKVEDVLKNEQKQKDGDEKETKKEEKIIAFL